MVVLVNDMQKAEDVHLILVHVIMQILYARLHSGLEAVPLRELSPERPAAGAELEEIPSAGARINDTFSVRL